MHTDFNPNIDYFSLSRACLEFVTDIEEEENGQISERKSRFDLVWLSRVRWSDHGAGVEITYGTRGSFTATLRSYRLILLVRLRRLLCSLLFNHFVFVSIIGGSQIIAFMFWLWLCNMGYIGVISQNCHSFVSLSSLTVPSILLLRPFSRCRHLSCLCKVFIMSLVVAKRWLLSSMNKEMGSTHPFKASGICHANSPLARGRTINWPKDLLHTKVWCGAIWSGPTAMYVSEYWFVTEQLNNWGWVELSSMNQLHLNRQKAMYLELIREPS